MGYLQDIAAIDAKYAAKAASREKALSRRARVWNATSLVVSLPSVGLMGWGAGYLLIDDIANANWALCLLFIGLGAVWCAAGMVLVPRVVAHWVDSRDSMRLDGVTRG